jgi:hypothetical protein
MSQLCESLFSVGLINSNCWFLILSNIAALPPCIYLSYLMKKTLRFLILEFLTILVSGLVSAFYHVCDCYDYCVAIIVAGQTIYNNEGSICGSTIYDNLWVWDRVMSTMVVCVILMHIADYNWLEKIIVYVLSWSIVYPIISSNNNLYWLAALLAILFNLCLMFWKWQLYKRSQWIIFALHNNWWDMLAAACLILIAFGFYILADNYSTNYWIYHSIWHLLIFTSVLFAIDINEGKRFCFCC